MRRLITLFAVLILLIGVPTSAYAQEPAEGTINGQVVNDTEGGGSVAGTEITLITYVNDVMSETRTAIADGEGKFQFDNVAIEYKYLVSARYIGVDYYYTVTFESGETTTHVEVGVCDVTTNDQAVRIGQAHTVINTAEDSLQINEVYWLVNDSDMTYVGTDGVLVFILPEGAFGFEAPSELIMDYELLDENTITYLVPFPPGERQLFYSYRLMKPDAAEFIIPMKINYPTDSLEILVGGDDIEVSISQLAPAEPVVASTGERYIHFHGENITRGTTINLSLSDLTGGSGFPLYIVWIIAGAVIVGIAIYLVSRKRRLGSDE